MFFGSAAVRYRKRRRIGVLQSRHLASHYLEAGQQPAGTVVEVVERQPCRLGTTVLDLGTQLRNEHGILAQTGVSMHKDQANARARSDEMQQRR